MKMNHSCGDTEANDDYDDNTFLNISETGGRELSFCGDESGSILLLETSIP